MTRRRGSGAAGAARKPRRRRDTRTGRLSQALDATAKNCSAQFPKKAQTARLAFRRCAERLSELQGLPALLPPRAARRRARGRRRKAAGAMPKSVLRRAVTVLCFAPRGAFEVLHDCAVAAATIRAKTRRRVASTRVVRWVGTASYVPGGPSTSRPRRRNSVRPRPYGIDVSRAGDDFAHRGVPPRDGPREPRV